MSKNALVLVHTSPEAREAEARRARKVRDTVSPVSRGAHDFSHRENTLRKEAGRLAMERLHNVLSNDGEMGKMMPMEALAYIKEGLNRAYGVPTAPKAYLDPDEEAAISGKATLRDALVEITQRAALPELKNAKTAKESDKQ